MVGEDIHRQIQALPGRVAADGCRANDDSGEVGRLLLQQERFAETFVLVVVRDGHQWVVFGDVLNLADPVDGRRRGVDATSDAAFFAHAYQGTERIVVDRTTQSRVELKAWIVGDAGQVNDRVTTVQGLHEQGLVAYISFDLRQIRMILDRIQHMISIDIQVQYLNAKPFPQELGNQNSTYITGAAGNQHLI